MNGFKQYKLVDDDVNMSSNNESDTEDESEDDAGDLLSEDLYLLGIIDDVSKMIKEKVDELKEDFHEHGSDCCHTRLHLGYSAKLSI